MCGNSSSCSDFTARAAEGPRHRAKGYSAGANFESSGLFSAAAANAQEPAGAAETKAAAEAAVAVAAAGVGAAAGIVGVTIARAETGAHKTGSKPGVSDGNEVLHGPQQVDGTGQFSARAGGHWTCGGGGGGGIRNPPSAIPRLALGGPMPPPPAKHLPPPSGCSHSHHPPPHSSSRPPTCAIFFLGAMQKATATYSLFACESAASPVSLRALFLSLTARTTFTTQLHSRREDGGDFL
jgi:hypothetical protein